MKNVIWYSLVSLAIALGILAFGAVLYVAQDNDSLAPMRPRLAHEYIEAINSGIFAIEFTCNEPMNERIATRFECGRPYLVEFTRSEPSWRVTGFVPGDSSRVQSFSYVGEAYPEQYQIAIWGVGLYFDLEGSLYRNPTGFTRLADDDRVGNIIISEDEVQQIIEHYSALGFVSQAHDERLAREPVIVTLTHCEEEDPTPTVFVCGSEYLASYDTPELTWIVTGDAHHPGNTVTRAYESGLPTGGRISFWGAHFFLTEQRTVVFENEVIGSYLFLSEQ